MKNPVRETRTGLRQSITRSAMRREAIAAVHGLIAARLEGNLGLLAAVSTDRSEHLTLRTGIAVLSTERSAALRAAARLVLEALLSIERLLRRAEDELLVAITANEGFVLIHICILLKYDRLTFADWHSKQDFLLARRQSKEAGD